VRGQQGADVKRASWLVPLLTGLTLASGPSAWAGDPVKGAGSTFAQKIIQQWSADTGGQVAYDGVGSGGGRAKLIAGEVDFAASDVPAKPDEVNQLKAKYGDIAHVPETAGGLAVIYKVDGLQQLKISGPTLARIFSGKVKNWNDPAIAADNGSPGPNLAIQVFVRSDKSGSSGVFTSYLAATAGGDWSAGSTEQFPTDAGQQGKQGSTGVADAVAGTNGGISYVEHGVARDKSLAEALVKNGGGAFRPPDAASVSAALDTAKTNGDGTVEINYNPTGQGYPISSVSYIIASTKLAKGKYDTMKAFLDYGLGAGQGKADGLGYAPLPAKLQDFAKAQAAKMSAG
jgi:phosphate transport system substrate-binding protein